MPKEIINPSTLPAARGFNHGIVASGRLLFLAGQDASDTFGMIVGRDDLVTQYEQVLRNLFVVVKEAGGVMEDIVKMTIFVKDREDYLSKLEELGEVHRAYFDKYYPAAALLEVKGFYHEDALIEIEGIAVLEEKDT